jgi:hypothetical protein
MKITAVALTFDPDSLRDELLLAAIESLAEADWVGLVCNDGLVRYQCANQYLNKDSNHTSGHGTNLQARIGCGTGADIVVLSDDDMFWRPGWRAQLEAWWSEAPDDVWLTGCHLEPLYGWNALNPETETYGGVTGLIRNSTGAASWSFRASDWSKIGPVPQKTQGWGDVPTCQRLRARGGRIAQLDLAEHRGLISTWGNQSSSFTQDDVAPVRAKLGA